MSEVVAQLKPRSAISPRTRAILLDAGFLLVLVWFIWTAYAPSLKHVHRADQWNYLVDMIPFTGFAESLEHSYSYNRSRLVAPGDVDLFRPVLFTLLAAERFLFEGDLGAYQVVGIVFHIGVCLLLFALLRQITNLSLPDDRRAPGTCKSAASFRAAGLLPHAVTAFFALNPATQELVIWNHLSGYLLFLIFLLGAMNLLLRHLSGSGAGGWRSPSLWGCWLLLLVSAFTYELGQLAAIFTGLFLFFGPRPKFGVRRRLARLALFATISLAYQVANAVDRHSHSGHFVVGHDRERIVDAAFKPETLPRAARFVAFTAVQPFFPSLLDESIPNDRLDVGEVFGTREGWHTTRKLFGPGAIIAIPVFLLLGGYTLLAIRWMLLAGMRRVTLVFLFAGGLYATYAAMTVFGRMNLRPKPGILVSNSYYTYIALLFILAAAFAAWQTLAWSCQSPLLSRWRQAVLAGLLILTVLGAEQVRRVNLDMADRLEYMAKPIHAVNAFVREHRHEADFSLAIDYRRSEPIPYRSALPVTDIVFARWLNVTEPKYRLAYRYGKLWVLNREPIETTPARQVEPSPEGYVVN